MADDIQPPINMVGISDLVNQRHANQNIKLDELERDLIGKGGLQMIPVSDPDHEFNSRMEGVAGAGASAIPAVGDELDDELPDETMVPDDFAGSSPLAPSVPQAPRVPLPNPVPYATPKPAPRNMAAEPPGHRPGHSGHSGYAGHQPQSYPAGYPAQAYPQQPYPQQAYPQQPYPQQPYPQQPYGYPPMPNMSGMPAGAQLDEALRDYGGYAADADLETEEETKSIMLDDIDELLGELAGYSVDTSGIAKVNGESELDEIKKVHRRLRRMYDKKRCHTFGTEVIMAGAHGLEYFFDGKKSYGPFRPDLTDWHNNIRPKLRNMRYETSSVVSDVMHNYNVGNVARIMIELCLSAFLHSKARQAQKGQAMYTADQMSDAYESLRDDDL